MGGLKAGRAAVWIPRALEQAVVLRSLHACRSKMGWTFSRLWYEKEKSGDFRGFTLLAWAGSAIFQGAVVWKR